MKKQKPDIFINTINVRPPARKALDILAWRNAIRAAESLTRNRTQLLDIYEDIMLDGHLESIVGKRIDAVTNLELKFFKADNTPDDEINALINKTCFEKLLRAIIKAKFYGYTLIELDWRATPEYINQTHDIDRRHVKPEMGIVVKNPTDTTGVDYTQHPFALFVQYDGLGILAKAAQYVIYKRNNTADWAEYNEVFGKPYPQGKYKHETSEKLLSDAFDKAGFDRYMVAPDDAEITLHTPFSASGSTDFSSFREAMNEELSILILGQNLTTKVGGGGSYAAARTHGEVEENKHISDREFTAKVLNELLVPMLQRAGYKADGAFSFIYGDVLKLTERIQVDTALAGLVPIPDDYFYTTYGVPMPDKADKKKKTELSRRPAMGATPQNWFIKMLAERSRSLAARFFFRKSNVMKF
jgi:hypothetical protein